MSISSADRLQIPDNVDCETLKNRIEALLADTSVTGGRTFARRLKEQVGLKLREDYGRKPLPEMIEDTDRLLLELLEIREKLKRAVGESSKLSEDVAVGE